MKNFYNLTPEVVASGLKVDVAKGLSSADVEQRRAAGGYNEFTKTRHSTLIEKFFAQFKSFMIIVLIVAAAISGVVGYMHDEGFTDAIIILAIVIINAIIGTAQEAKAENALEALEKLSSPQCKVVRGGKVHTIPSRELVAGDVVVLETGDAVPADMRLIESVNLKIEEAALTGESVPVEKSVEAIAGDVPLGDRLNMAFGSTTVSYGRGRGIVTAIGMESEVGRIASMIQSVPTTKTPLQAKLDHLGKVLAIASLGICVVLFVVGILYGKDLLTMFMTAVSLAVAAIPEGLPAVATVVLAVGVQRLVKKNAIVRRLPSVETLGSTQVICSDKTGTLTRNRMTVVKVYIDGHTEDVESLSAEGFREFEPLVRYSVLANDSTVTVSGGKRETTGDPTETAMLDLGLKYGMEKGALEGHLFDGKPVFGEVGLVGGDHLHEFEYFTHLIHIHVLPDERSRHFTLFQADELRGVVLVYRVPEKAGARVFRVVGAGISRQHLLVGDNPAVHLRVFVVGVLGGSLGKGHISLADQSRERVEKRRRFSQFLVGI